MFPLRTFIFLSLLILAGCGYTIGQGAGQSVLPAKYKTLAIGHIKNPSTEAWLEPRLRKLLRDEFTNRGGIVWVDDKNKADALIDINIKRYYRPSAVTDEDDETLRSSATITFTASLRSTTDDSVIWQSSEISESWPFYSGDEAKADNQVTLLAVRVLADRMTQAY